MPQPARNNNNLTISSTVPDDIQALSGNVSTTSQQTNKESSSQASSPHSDADSQLNQNSTAASAGNSSPPKTPLSESLLGATPSPLPPGNTRPSTPPAPPNTPAQPSQDTSTAPRQPRPISPANSDDLQLTPTTASHSQTSTGELLDRKITELTQINEQLATQLQNARAALQDHQQQTVASNQQRVTEILAIKKQAEEYKSTANTDMQLLQHRNTTLTNDKAGLQQALKKQAFIPQLQLLKTNVQTWLYIQTQLADYLQTAITKETKKNLLKRNHAALKWYRAMYALHTSCTLPLNQPHTSHTIVMSPLIPSEINLNAELHSHLALIQAQTARLEQVRNVVAAEAEQKFIEQQRQACDFIHKLYTQKMTYLLENPPSAVAQQAKTIILLLSLATAATTLTTLAIFAPSNSMLQFMHGMLQQFTAALLAGSALAIAATVVGGVAVAAVVATTGCALYNNHRRTQAVQEDLRRTLNPIPADLTVMEPARLPMHAK